MRRVLDSFLPRGLGSIVNRVLLPWRGLWGYVLIFMTAAAVWGRKTTAPYLPAMSFADMRFCLM